MIKSKKLLIALTVLIALILSVTLVYSCNKQDGETPSSNLGETLDNIDTSIDDNDKSSEYNESGATAVVFSDSSVAITGSGAVASGCDVTLSGAGTFILSGKCEEGSVTVDAGKGNKATVVLDGLELANADGVAIYIKSGKKITLTLAEGKENVLSDGESYSIVEDGSTLDGTIFSKSDLVINGNGLLTVNGNNAHGIVSKDGLTITGGSISVSSKSTGICGKDFLKIVDAQISVSAGSDALRSDNETDADMGYIYVQSGTFTLDAYNDAMQAYSFVIIEDGDFDISTSATSSSESAKGIKGGSGVKISGGTFTFDTEDDGLHTNGDILVTGGDFTINTGDDGVHADGTLEITGGNIVISRSYEGIEGTHIVVSGGYIDITSSDDGMNASGGNNSNSTAVGGRPGMDMFEATDGSITVSGGYIIIHNEGDGVDSNGSLTVSGGVILVDGPQSGGNGSFDYASTAKITGGVVITLGTSEMAQNFSEATQGTMLVGFNGYAPIGTTLSVCDENGNVIVAFTSTKYFSCALFSAPEIKKGSTYSIYMDADIEGLDMNGYAHNTTQTGGTLLGSIEMTDYIYGQGSGMGGGGKPGGGGRPR